MKLISILLIFGATAFADVVTNGVKVANLYNIKINNVPCGCYKDATHNYQSSKTDIDTACNYWLVDLADKDPSEAKRQLVEVVDEQGFSPTQATINYVNSK